MTAFFDTNVILYLFETDDAKAERADELLHSGGAVSVQVLNEIANVCRSKRKLDWSAIDEIIATVRNLLTIVPVTIEVHDHGLDVARRHQLAVYDSMIVAAALAADCDTLWSEDMHNGLVVDHRLTIRNPFA